jgi:integrase
MQKSSAQNYFHAGRQCSCCVSINDNAHQDRIRELFAEIHSLLGSQVCYRDSCKLKEPEMSPAVKDSKTTVYKPYQEFDSRGKERFRVVHRTPTGQRKSKVYRTLAEANRAQLQLEKHHSQDYEKTVDVLIQEYRGHCDTMLGYKPRTLHMQTHRLLTIFAKKSALRLSTLTPARVETMCQDLWARSRKGSGKRLAVATHRNDAAILRRFGKWACKAKYVRENPFAGLNPPGKPNVGKVHLRTDERIKWVKACEEAIANGSDLALAALFCLYRGTRANEILRRQVSDIDDGGTKLIISNTKTKAGNRRLSIPEALRGHFAALCVGKAPTDPLFAQSQPGSEKKSRRSGSLSRFVRKLCAKAGVTRICTHSLRGMNAEMQLEGGESEDVVAKSLGHTSIDMTMRHYINRDVQDSVAARKVDIQLSNSRRLQSLNTPLSSAQAVLSTLAPDVAEALKALLSEARATH